MLRNPPTYLLEEEYMIYNIQRLALTEHDFEIEHQRQTARRKAANTANGKGAKKNVSDR